MTYETMMNTIEMLKDDAYVYTNNRNGRTLIGVTLCDFEGFGENNEEIYRPYDNETAVEEFLEMLLEEALEVEDDFYTIYHFDGFDVKVGYESYDI